LARKASTSHRQIEQLVQGIDALSALKFGNEIRYAEFDYFNMGRIFSDMPIK